MTSAVADAVRLSTPAEVDAFLDARTLSAIFKAGDCSQTDWALFAVRRAFAVHPDVSLGFVPVTKARAASQHLVERTGVRHESPQILLFRRGQLVFHCDHGGISEAALTEALARLSADEP